MRRKLNDMRGIGDVVEAAAKVVGVYKLAETVSRATGRDCGCKRRKEALNKMFPFRNTETENESKGESND